MSESNDDQSRSPSDSAPPLEGYYHGSHYAPSPPPLPELPGAANLMSFAHPQWMYHHYDYGRGTYNGAAYYKDSESTLQGEDGPSRKVEPSSEKAPPIHQDHYQNESSAYAQPADMCQSPTSNDHPPPLPPVAALAVTPAGQSPRDPTNTIYHNSPYYSEAPNLGTGSGSSESSTSTADTSRPVPAKSAFMCFSEAKGKEISVKMKVKGSVSD